MYILFLDFMAGRLKKAYGLQIGPWAMVWPLLFWRKCCLSAKCYFAIQYYYTIGSSLHLLSNWGHDALK